MTHLHPHLAGLGWSMTEHRKATLVSDAVAMAAGNIASADG